MAINVSKIDRRKDVVIAFRVDHKTALKLEKKALRNKKLVSQYVRELVCGVGLWR